MAELEKFPSQNLSKKSLITEWLSKVRQRKKQPSEQVETEGKQYEKPASKISQIDEVITLGSLILHELDFNLEVTPIGDDFDISNPLKPDRVGSEVPKNKLSELTFLYNYVFLISALNEMATNTLSEGTSQYLNLLTPNYGTVPIFKTTLRNFINEALEAYVAESKNKMLYGEKGSRQEFELRQKFLQALLKDFMKALPHSIQETTTSGTKTLDDYLQHNQEIAHVVEQMKTKIDRKKNTFPLSATPTFDEVLKPFLARHPEIEAFRANLSPEISSVELIMAWLATKSKNSGVALFFYILDRKLMLFNALPSAGQYSLETGTFSVNSRESKSYQKFIKMKAVVNGALLGLSFTLPFPVGFLSVGLSLTKSVYDGRQVLLWPGRAAAEQMSTHSHEFIHKLSAYKNDQEAKVGFIRLKKKVKTQD